MMERPRWPTMRIVEASNDGKEDGRAKAGDNQDGRGE